MNDVWELAPWIIAMILLIGASSLFSATEAALFSLEPAEVARLKRGNRAARLAEQLLQDPERLLSALLFWNLVVNLSYFTLSSMISVRLEQIAKDLVWAPYAYAIGSLILLIFLGEMVPKSLGVITRNRVAPLLAVPAALAARVSSPVMPVLTLAMRLATRFVWPDLRAETRLEVDDLERLINASTSDEHLIEHEQAVLKNIIQLSDIRVDEWMRPRSQFVVFHPPVSLKDLQRRRPPSGYLLVTEPDTEEIASALHLQSVHHLTEQNLERLTEPVVFIPWCATVADALERLRIEGREVGAILNEYGETIGILTFDDILDTLFSYSPSRSKRILDQDPIHQVDESTWLVAGIVNVRRLSKRLRVPFPSTRNLTVGGVIQESLQRIARAGDETNWGPLQLKVLETPARGHMLVEIRLVDRNAGEGE